MNYLKCSGWWEQQGMGRQPMEDLRLQFSDGQLSGNGTDIVGDFVFQGTLTDDRVFLLKQYIGQHQIEYHGTSDGEGVYFGVWNCHGIPGGNWSIRILAVEESGEIDELDVSDL